MFYWYVLDNISQLSDNINIESSKIKVSWTLIDKYKLKFYDDYVFTVFTF